MIKHIVVATNIAVKFNQLDAEIPPLSDLIQLATCSNSLWKVRGSNFALTINGLKTLEEEILTKLEWNINELTSFDFLEAYLGLGTVIEGDLFT